jgi:hypothetical protein
MRISTRPGHRSARRNKPSTPAQPQAIVIPAQTELSEAYTWAVNAAVGSDRPELAHELALSFAREA